MKLMSSLSSFFRNRKVGVSVVIFFALIQIVIIGSVAFILSSLQIDRITKSTDDMVNHHLQLIKKSITITEQVSEIGFSADDYKALKPLFSIQLTSLTGTTKLISSKGDVLIANEFEGVSQAGSMQHNFRLKEQFGKQSYFDEADIIEYFEYIPDYDAFVVVALDKKALFADLNSNKIIIVVLAFLLVFTAMLILFRLTKKILKPLNDISNKLIEVSEGKAVEKSDYLFKNEFGEMSLSLNKVIDSLSNNATFAEELANANYFADFKAISNSDVLGQSLVKMRDSLVEAQNIDKNNKESEQRRDWVNTGIAQFSDILRENLSQQELAYKIVGAIVQYINANQGGMFIYDDSDLDNLVLNLEASYAFSRRKFLEKQILVGEGLIGTCAIEKQTIHLTEIPESYADITSGLGNSAPKSLLIVPLLVEDQLFGVIEIASLNDFQDFEIEFLEKLAESIAITMANLKRNNLTHELLDQSKGQSEELAAQEEEMRQNMEELLATQEESIRREREVNSVFDCLDKAVSIVQLDAYGNIKQINHNLTIALNSDSSAFKGQHYSSIIYPNNNEIDNNNLWIEMSKGNLVKRKETVIANNVNTEVSSTYSPIMDENDQLERVLLIVQ